MTTTLTIIVIIAMLWLTWPRTPKVKIRPSPSPENLRAIREALMQLEQRPVFVNCVVTCSGPLVTIESEAWKRGIVKVSTPTDRRA